MIIQVCNIIYAVNEFEERHIFEGYCEKESSFTVTVVNVLSNPQIFAIYHSKNVFKQRRVLFNFKRNKSGFSLDAISILLYFSIFICIILFLYVIYLQNKRIGIAIGLIFFIEQKGFIRLKDCISLGLLQQQ